MEQKNKQVSVGYSDNDLSLGSSSTSVVQGVQNASGELSDTPTLDALDASMVSVAPRNRVALIVGLTLFGLVMLVGLAVVALRLHGRNQASTNRSTTNVNSRYDTQDVTLKDLQVDKIGQIQTVDLVTINGALQVNSGFVLTPGLQPATPHTGQLYYDKNTNALAYYNGTEFVSLLGNPGVEALGGVTGQINLGGGLVIANGGLANAGVLSVQGQKGDVNLVAGSGITINGTTISNSGVISVVSSSPSITVTDDGNGNITLGGSGSGTISSLGGTTGRIAKFTGVQQIADSLIGESGTTITVNGDLSVTGTVAIGSPLTVANGGTGAGSLTANGVLVGNGVGAVSSVVAGAAGQCLISTAGAPAFAACPGGGGGVTSLNGLSGALSVANASGVGSTITIDDATTAAKGIASFNSTNFTVGSGAVNTIQNINAAATPTFAGVNTNSVTPSAALTVGISAQTALLQGSTTTITSSGAGNDIVLNSADTIELQDNTNVTGNVVASGDVAVNGGDLTSTGALNITPGGTLTAGVSSQTLTLQGNASTSLRATNGANTTIVAFTSPTANTTLNFPALSAGTYTICTTSGNCAGAAVTLQSAYDNSTSPEIVLDATRGALTIRDNATPLGANLLEVQNNGGGTTYLAVTATGLTVTGTATVTSNINSSGGGLQTNGTTRVDNSGNATNIGNVSLSGSISGGTTISGSGNINTTGGGIQTNSSTRIDNSGNLTNIGNLTLSGAISGGTTYSGSGNINTTGGVIQTNSTTRIDNSGNLVNIAAITASGNATLQGGSLTLGTNAQAGTVVLNDGSSNTGTLAVAALGQNTVYTLPDPGAGTATICISTGNCAGTGGGVTTSGGTNNTLAKFTGSQTIGDSIITDNGSTVTIGGTLAVNTISPSAAFTAGATGQTTTLQGSITTITSTGAGNDIILNSADTIELQDNTNITGNLDVSGTLFAGTGDAFQVDTSGNVTAGTYNTNTFTSSNLQFGAAATATIQSAASQALTITGNAASTWSTSSGNLTVQAASSLNFKATAGNIVLGTSDTTGTLLVLDIKTDAGDPAGTDGAIYYNSNAGSFRCYQSGAWANCITASGGFVSLQNAYDNGNTISTDASGDIAFTLNNQNFTVANAAGATGSSTFSLTDGSNASPAAQLVLITNNDVNEAIANGLTIGAAAGGITDGLDVSDGDLVNAINVGDNVILGTTATIDFSNFDVTSGGAITIAGDIAVNGGDITSSGTLNINSGGTIELQDGTNVTGNLTATGTYNTNTFTGSALTFGSAATATIQSAASQALTITGNAASTWSTSSGNLTVQAASSLNLKATTGNVVLGTSDTTGTLLVVDVKTDAGDPSGTDGAIYYNSNSGAFRCYQSGAWANCITASGGFVSLQNAYDNGNTISTDASGDIAFTLNNQNFTVASAAGTTSSTIFSLSDGSNASPATQLVLISNNDVDEAIANGLTISSAAGGITDGLDVSDADLVNAINIGANDILSNGTTISSAELNLLDGHDTALVDINDAVNTAITGTGALNSGSITSGFGLIDTGADNITTTGTVQGTTAVLTSAIDRVTAGTLTIGNGTATQINLGTNVTVTGGNTFTSGTGTVLLQGNTDIANTASLATKRAATYTTAGSADDVAISVASLYILDTSGAAQTITGIVAGRDGQHLTLVNADAALAVTLSNLSGSSSANNRISTGTGADVSIAAGGSIDLIYDTANNLWRVVGGLAGGTCASCANQQLSNLSSTNINTALNATSGNLNLTTTTSGNIVLNSAGTIELQDNTNVTGTLGVSSTLTVTAGGASIAGNTTIATSAGNTLGLGNSTGALTVTGNSSSTFVINGITVDATEFNRLDGKDAALVDTNDAVNTAITGTGALDAGSITSNFGSINTGADNITTTGTLQGTTSVLTQSLDRTSAGALNIGASTATSIVLGQNTSLTGAATFTSGTGTVLLQGNTDIANTVSLATKRGTTYTAPGSADDVAINVASLYILDTSGAAQTITGIAAGRDGQYLTLVNGDATLAVTLSNNSGSSAAANRITTGTGADVSVPAGGSVSLIYDSASSLWRIVGGVAGGTCSSCANQQLSNLSGTNINAALNATSGNLSLTTTTSGNIVLNSAGTIELQDNTNVTGNLVATGNGTFQGGTATIGTTSQQGSLVLHDGNGQNATISVGSALAANTALAIPTAVGANDTFCLLTLANCVGTGGGVSGSGTNNQIVKFTSTGSTVGDSTISDDGSNVTTSADLIIQGGAATLGTSSQQGTLVLHDGNGETATISIGSALAANTALAIPTGVGASDTVCLLTLANCLGGAGGGANTALSNLASVNINTALNATSANLNLTTTTSGNIVLNSAGTIELQDNTNVTGTLGVSSTLTVTAGGASIAGNTTIATSAGNTLGLGNSTGALTVTGSSSSTFVLNGVTVDATEFNRLDGKDAALVDTNDAVNTAITGTGALGSGSITSGFGSIDTGADNISTTGTLQGTTSVLTQSLDRTSAGALNIGASTATSIVLGQNTSLTGAATFTSGTGTVLLQGNTDIAATVSFATKRGATYTTPGSADDVALNVASLYILDTSGAAQTITGITAGRDGQYLTLVNGDAALAATLSNNSGSSAAANRITTGTGADVSVPAGGSVTLVYDTASSLWRLVGGVAGGTCSTCANTALSNLASVNINTALNATSGNLNLTTTTSGNIVLNSAGTIELQDNTNVTGTLGVSSTLTVTAGGASIAGNTTIATSAGNTLGLGNSTGALTVTGSSSSTFVINGVTVDATEFNRLDGKDAALVDTNDAVNTAITGTGALDSGSITSNFGSINTGADNITTTGTVQGTTSVLTQSLDRTSAGALNIGTTTATSIVLGQNTSLTGAATFTSGTGTVLLQGNTDIANTVSLATKVGSTFTTAGTSNNAALNVASFYLLDTSGAAQVINGITAGRDGQRLTLTNVDAASSVTLANNSGSATGSKIITGTGSDVTLAIGASIELVYDSANSFWRVLGGVAGGTCVSCANTALSNLASVNINTALNATSADLNLTTTTSGNIVLNSAGTIELQDNTNVTGTLGVSSTLTVTAGGASIAGNTTIATSAGNTLGLGNSTGALTVTGSSSSTFVINGVTVDATEFNRLDGKDAALVDTNDAVNTAITGTGALDSGSITSNFGAINTGADNITTTGTLQGTTSVLTQSLDRTSAGALNIGASTATSIVLGQNTSLTGAATFTSGTGTVLLQGNTDIAATVSLATKRGTTYTTAGSANDVALNVASLYVLDTSGAAQTITGIAAGRDGQYLTLVNGDAALAVTLSNNSGSSAAANRITTGTGSDILLAAGASITLVYDTNASLWRVVGGTAGGAGTCPTCANQQLSNLSSVNLNTALNATSGDLNLTTTTSGNIVLNSAGTIELQDNTNVTGTLGVSSTLTVTAGGASIAGNTTIATSAGNTLGLGNSTGALTVTGSSSSTFVINGVTVDATEFNRLDGKDAALVDTNDAVNTAITGTGALDSGSITSNFGSINTGADNITTTGTVQGTTSVLTQSLDRTSAGALNIGTTTATSIVLGQNTSLTGAATFTSGTGTVLLQGNTDIAATVSLATKRGTTYTTAGSANDVALNVASLYILDTSGAAQTITGIAAGRDGQYVTLVNGDAALAVTLSNLSGSSSAANQITTGTGADVTIPAGGSTTLVYDTASSLWRVIGGVAGGTCSTCANTALSNLASVNINTALNTTSANLNLTTTTSGNIVLNSAGGTIELQDATNVTGTLGVSSTLTVTAGGASIAGNTTIATSAGNTLGLGNSTGTLTVTGSSSSTFVINGITVDATEFNRLDGKDAALVDTNDAVATAITGTGALDAGSITSNFGSINTGADNITTTGTVQGTTSVLTQSLDRTSAGALNIGTGTATSIVLGQNTSLSGAATFTSGTGTVLLQGNTDIANTVSLATKRGTTYTTAGSANDVAISTASLYILDTSGAAQTITGIVAGRDGQYLTLINGDATLAVTLANLSGSSAAANQISTGTGANVSIPAGASTTLVYDTASSLWRVIGGVAGGTCSTCANTALSNLASVNINTALNATSTDLNLTTTTSGNIVLNSAGTIELQDNTNVTGTLGVSSTLTVTAGGASIAGNTTIATSAGNTLGLGNSTGALTVTGSSSSTFVINGITVDATEFNRLDGKDAALVDTNDAVNTAITGTGALGSGSITSAFGSIDVGTDSIQGGTATLTGASALTLGTTGTNTGAILFKGSTAASGTITLIGQNNPGTRTITLPDETGTICTSAATSPSTCTNFAPATGSTVYATRQLDNLSSVAINAALAFQSNQAANINFAAAAAAAGNSLSITGQTAGATANNGGDITIQGGTATTTGQGGTTTIRGGNTTATGTNGTLTLDAGSGATTANGTINLGTANASTVNLGSVGSTAKATTIHIADSTDTTVTQAITIGSNSNAAHTTAIQGGSGATAITLTPQTTGVITIGAAAGTGNIVLGSSSATQSVLIGNGAGASTVSIGNTTTAGSTVNIAGAATANGITDTINIGTGNTAGTGAKVIHIGDGTPAGTGTNTITIGSNANTANVTTIQGGNGTGAIALTPQTTGTIVIGAAAGTGNITLGSSSATQTVLIGNGAGAATVSLANAGTAGNTVNVAGAATANGNTDTINIGTGNTAGTGAKVIHIGDGNPAGTGTNTITIGSNANTANVTTIKGGNGAGAITFTPQTTGTIVMGAAVGTGSITLGSSSAAQTVIVGGGTGASTVQIANNVATATGNTVSIAGGATATGLTDTINIGTGNTVGTGAKVIHIGDGTPAGTNTITIGSIANTANVTTIQGGNGAGAIALTPQTTGTIVIGAAAGTGNITLGSSSATQTVLIGNGAGASTVSVGNATTAGSTVNVAGAATANGITDTVNIATGNTAGTGSKVVHIADGTPAGTGTNTVTIGSIANTANVTTIQGGNGTGAIALTPQTTGTIVIGAAAGTGNITLGSSSATQSVLIGNGAGASTVSIGNTTTAGSTVNVAGAATANGITDTINIGTGNTAGTGAKVIHIGDGNPAGTGTNTITIGSNANTANVTTIKGGNGAGAITFTPQTTGTIVMGAAAGTGSITLGSSSAAQTVIVGGGTGASTVQIANNVATATGNTVSIAGGATATGLTDTINIGTGNTVGTGAKVIHIGDGTPAGTNTVTIGSIANTANVTTIQGGNGAGAIALTPQTTGTIVIGAAAGTGNITLGSSSATQSVLIGNGAGASTVSIGNTTTAGSTVNVAGAATANGITDTINIGTGNTAGTGAKVIHIGDGNPAGTGTNTITIGSNANTANVTTIKGGNGAGAITLTPQTTGTIVMGAAAGTGSITLGSSSAAQTVIVGGGTGASTVQIANNVATATGNTVSIAGGATATGLTDTINIGTGNTVGTGAKVIHIGDGTPAGTNTVTIGSNANTANVTTIQGGNGAGAIALTPQTTGTIVIGAAAGTGSITLGSSSAAQSVLIGNGAGAATVSIANTGTAGNTVNIAGAATATGNTDTVNIATGNTAGTGAKVVHIADGTPGGTGTNSVTIGSISALANTTAIQGGNGSSAVTIQSAASGTIGIGTNNTANTIQLGSTTLSSGTQTINIGNNNTAGGTTNITIGSGSSATGGTTTLQAKGALNFTAGANSAWTVGGVLTLTANSISIPRNDSFDEVEIGDNFADVNDSATRLNIGSASGNSVIRLGESSLLYGSVYWDAFSNIFNIATPFSTSPLQLQANGGALTVKGASTFQNLVDSTAALQVQNNGGSEQLTVDTTNSRVYIGDTTADTTGSTLILDTKNDTGDPTGVDGAMYYNSAYGRFRCYQNAVWVDCIGGSGVEYLRAEMRSVQNSNIGTNDHIKFANVDASGGGSISLDTATTYTNGAGASIGRFTLAAGKTYKLSGSAKYADFSAATGAFTISWYNVTGSAQLGSSAGIVPGTYTAATNRSDTAEAVITPAVSTLVELRIMGVASLNSIGYTTSPDLYYPNAFIEVIDSGGGNGARAAEFVRAEMRTQQTTNVATNDHLKFETVDKKSGSSISLDTSTTYTNGGGASIGRFTLAAGKTYILHGTIPIAGWSANTGYLDFSWYDVTNTTLIGSNGGLEPDTGTAHQSRNAYAEAMITTTASTTVELRISSSAVVSFIGFTTTPQLLYPSAFVEVVSDGTTIAQFVGATASVNGQAGYVPAPVAGQQGSVLLGDGTWSSGVTFLSGAATFQNSADSTTAFRILNASGSGSVPQFVVDTTNSRVYIGNPTGDDVGTLLVADTKTSTTEPTGVNGGIYYNSTFHSMRCYQDGAWTNCAINAIDHVYNFEDEFLSGGTASASIGDLNWALTTSTSCTIGYNPTSGITLSHDHPGVLTMTMSAATNNGCLISSNTNRTVIAAAGDVVKTSAAVSSGANGVYVVGLTNQTGSAQPTSGVWWEARPATDTNWRYCYANNAAATCADNSNATPTISANAWTKLEIRVVSATAVDFIYNGTVVSLTGITVDLGATNKLWPTAGCHATTTSAITCYADYYQWRGTITTSGGR